MDLDTCIISFLSGNGVCLGQVVRTNKDRLQVRSETEKTEKVTVKNLLANHGPAADGDMAAFQAVRGRIESVREELDLELLWETLLDAETSEELGLEALADEYFGEHRPEQIVAMASALIDDPVRFRRRGVLFTPRSHEEAEEILELRRKRAEKAALREAEEEWLSEALRHQGDEPAEVPETFAPLVQKCLDLLLLGTTSDGISILTAVRPKDTPQHTALLLLQKTGRLPEGADPFLLENGIHAGFSQAVLAAAEEIPDYEPDDKRRDFSGLPTFSIDDADTREVDDAISVVQEGDETVVAIHIADPAHFVHKDDPLDRVAAERPLTLYLPTTTVTMLPERIGCDLASLREGELRPSLSFEVRFSAAGEILDWSFAGGQVCVTHRLTYDDADAMLAPDAEHELAAAMRALVPITDHLRQARLAAGGFELSRPEFKVHVADDEIDVQRIPPSTPSRRIVSELMVLANRLTAEYALRHDIPIIYRVQDPPSQTVNSLAEYDPVAFVNEVRKIKRTRLSTHPQPHTGLGLELYTQVSSPIRRYADLVIQRQLAAHVEGEPFPYSQEELFEVVGTVDRTAYQNRQLEREENRHWLLEYVKRELMDEPHTATVVQQNGRVIFAELTAIGERGLLHTRQPVKVGDCVDVKIKDIRPQKSEFILQVI
jgi:exoribonuclease-2